MSEIIIHIIEWGGYFGIFLLMVIENVFPPIPSELIMGLGGVAVARGTMEFWPLMLAGTAGATAGNYVLFLAGDRWGYEKLEPFVARWGRWLTLEWQDIEKTSEFLRRHGQWVVFVLRFSPLLRSIVSVPAGLAHMSHWKFLAFTFAGAAIWNFILVKGGQLLAGWLEETQGILDAITIGVILLCLAAYAWRVATWKPRS
jgi:membrane protein DedA with SNARE-associated domain